MWGSRKRHVLDIWGSRKNIIPSPFPFLIWIALIHYLENKSILRVVVLFTFIMILVHFIWVFGPFLCILNFFASFYFRCFSCHISVGSFYVFQHTRLTTRVWTYATNKYWHNYKWLINTLKVPLLIFHHHHTLIFNIFVFLVCCRFYTVIRTFLSLY